MKRSEYLTPAEVAAKLRVDVWTVRRWLREGKIAGAVQFGRLWRIPDSVLGAKK